MTSDDTATMSKQTEEGDQQPTLSSHTTSNFAEAFFELAELPFEFAELPFETALSDETSASVIDQDFKEEQRDENDDLSRLLDEYEHLDLGEIDEGVREPLQRLVEHLLQQQQKPIKTKRRHKLTFVLGTANMWLTAYWLGRYPQTFHVLYTYKCIVLFSLRWVFYRFQNMHYYMLDFCYFANILVVITLNYFPTNIKLLKLSFAYSLGPLAWSILTFRNAVVYHSLDKMTSLFLHAYPACSIWVARWYPSQDMAALLLSSPSLRDEWQRASLWEMVALPMLPYLLWAVLYYCKIFIVSSQRISTRGYATLFQYVTAKPTFYGRMIARSPQVYQPLVYMCLHLSMTAVSMALCCVWWHSFWCCCAFMMVMGCIAAANGANYYFEVFAYRYVGSLGGAGGHHGKEEHSKKE